MSRKFALSLLLTALLSGCMTPPAELNLALSRPTIQNKYVVAIQPMVEPIAINAMHAWEVKVSTPSNAPVLGARFAVDGGMPQHGHGLPTQPRITRELGGGRYLLEGMKFSMTGWWEIKLRVETPEGGIDNVTFNKVIELPAAAKT